MSRIDRRAAGKRACRSRPAVSIPARAGVMRRVAAATLQAFLSKPTPDFDLHRTFGACHAESLSRTARRHRRAPVRGSDAVRRGAPARRRHAGRAVAFGRTGDPRHDSGDPAPAKRAEPLGARRSDDVVRDRDLSLRRHVRVAAPEPARHRRHVGRWRRRRWCDSSLANGGSDAAVARLDAASPFRLEAGRSRSGALSASPRWRPRWRAATGTRAA